MNPKKLYEEPCLQLWQYGEEDVITTSAFTANENTDKDIFVGGEDFNPWGAN